MRATKRNVEHTLPPLKIESVPQSKGITSKAEKTSSSPDTKANLTAPIENKQFEISPHSDTTIASKRDLPVSPSSSKNIATENVAQPPSLSNIPFSYIALLNALKGTKPALVADLKNARFELAETPSEKDATKPIQTLTLIFTKKWNFDRVNTATTKNIITEILESTFGGNWILNCRIDE